MFGFSNVSLTWSLADPQTAEEIEHSLICQSSLLVAHNTQKLLASLAECGAKASGVTALGILYPCVICKYTHFIKAEAEARGSEVMWLVCRMLWVEDERSYPLPLFNDTGTIILP